MWIARLISSMSDGLGLPRAVLQLDVATLSAMIIVYVAIVCLAVAAPAARALRVQPAIILRSE
jgi:hypothetical protein